MQLEVWFKTKQVKSTSGYEVITPSTPTWSMIGNVVVVHVLISSSSRLEIWLFLKLVGRNRTSTSFRMHFIMTSAGLAWPSLYRWFLSNHKYQIVVDSVIHIKPHIDVFSLMCIVHPLYLRSSLDLNLGPLYLIYSREYHLSWLLAVEGCSLST